ncbi:BPSL1445 family SYLF domain-containing lipoprotein [Extensimonas vulgaris]|jgi:lipid-binding SYLF domain-containing protein|uniref:Las17-binding protein actin regulator n=1 Tax=Extensimonas vulgaris TaxID=1031594 RepID=A0A369ARA0_9BURK|nr:YSC84-related protein [Extensimonas vulgaris]RCX10868.1 Las17-binding protein actin regulator [Extensimonas vulgaris]TWI41540.1 Las17-binding protein actin regulator [Extensimonas vulgaris]TXD16963.1 twin-arginine translocation pathway signal [Extensimonas vulgaris]
MRFPFLCTLAVAALAGSMGLTACTTTGETDTAPNTSARVALDAEVNDTLNRLYKVAPDTREMVAKAAGVLVFPSVIGGSFVVGGGYGRGAMLVDGRTQGYYSLGTGSIGWQIGAQSKSVIYVFNTREALAKFLDSTGWVAGVDATVAVAHIGANGRIDSETIRQPVVGFVMNNAGLEAGVSLQGTKISRISL